MLRLPNQILLFFSIKNQFEINNYINLEFNGKPIILKIYINSKNNNKYKYNRIKNLLAFLNKISGVKMEHRKVLKFLQIIGVIFIIVSLVEIVFIIVMHFTPFTLNGDSILLSEFIYAAEIVPLSGTLLWIFLIIASVCFLILGFFMYKIILSKTIESWPLAKYMVVLGMVILLGGFVKMNFLVLLGKINIDTISGPIRFQSAIYSLTYTPIMVNFLWIFFILINCSILIAGLCVTASAIKWTLIMEQTENS